MAFITVTLFTSYTSNVSGLFFFLSVDFGSETLKFGRLNLSLAGHIAQKYNISLRMNSEQLPTLIMFQNGKEIIRTPELDVINNSVKKIPLSYDNIVELMDLITWSKRPPKETKKNKIKRG